MKCPHCEKTFKQKRIITVCSEEHKVSRKRAFNEIPLIVEELNNDKKGSKYLKQLISFIREEYPRGKTFCQEELRNNLSTIDDAWSNTFGDKLRAFLGFLECRGVINMVKFRMQKPGHLYRVSEGQPCKYWDLDKMKCNNCKIKTLKSGEERDVNEFKNYYGLEL